MIRRNMLTSTLSNDTTPVDLLLGLLLLCIAACVASVAWAFLTSFSLSWSTRKISKGEYLNMILNTEKNKLITENCKYV